MEAVKKQLTKNSIQRYQKYKDSGIEWLGEIPEHWELKRFKHLFKEKKITHNIELNSGSISFGKVVYKDDEKIPLATKKSYQVLNKGEFLINPLNLNYDLISLRIALSDKDVVVSSGYIIVQNAIEISKSYFKWLLHIFDIAYMKTLGSGVRQTLSFTHIANSELVFPSLQEQTAIATFLDDKTQKIEEAIAIKEQQIVLLKERKQILIHKAVTRGLDDTVPLKDSGVDWIGEIPEHWEVKALKFICYLQSGDFISSDDFKEEGYPVFGGNGFRAYSNNYTNEGFYALIGRQGALCGNVNYARGKFYATEHAVVVYPLNNEDVLWLGETIKQANFNRLSQSAAQPGIAVGVIKNEVFPYPSSTEQKEIASYIISITNKTEEIISLKQEEIEKLKEYKSSLINSVVTGKVNVC
ncbi:restriction endonuclease subunit S [Tenacibaculum ascidiaceicola]|uniref:restriction endonuclease subunit S n=1 Tax=Tenacibaculum ascidiaceicola TaxID=1699411 RepID=UPI003CE45405